MPHISIPQDTPGIRGPMAFRPDTARPLNELADVLLHKPSSLSPGERELIATFVSSGNDCTYCQTIHGAVAAHHLASEALVADVKRDYVHAAVSPKMKALLAIAGKVRESGKNVSAADVQKARDEGASDLDLHDTVLIAAAFSMFNRYVDGLATLAPEDPEFYRSRAAKLAADGYMGTNADITKNAGK